MLERMEVPAVADCLKTTGVSVFNGECSWEPGQLEAELQRGMWLIVRSPEVLAAMTAPQSASDAVGDVWDRTLQSLGGDYAELTRIPVDCLTEDIPDIER